MRPVPFIAILFLQSFLKGVKAHTKHDDSGQCFLNSEPHLPRVALIATGGTISGKGNSPTDTTHYRAGAFDISDLVYPIQHEFDDEVQLLLHRSFQIDSINLNPIHLLTLHHTLEEYLSRPDIRGAVLSMGSTVAPVVARFLQHTISIKKNVVVTSSSKPHTAYGAEGLGNLLAAIHTAAMSEFIGVVILANDQIFDPHGTRKDNNRFVPGPDSLVGVIANFRPKIKRRPRYVPKTFDITMILPEQRLPVIQVFIPYIGFGGGMIEWRFGQPGANIPDGIILEALDDGYWPDESREIFERYASGKVLVTVPNDGCCDVDYGRIHGAVPGNHWTIRDMPIMLATMLAAGLSREEISDFIQDPYHEGKAMY